jgi:hypothetical protein
VNQAISAAAGFLIAVLWFDLMFDVQLWPHGNASPPPTEQLDSISAYYHRVTTTASPMGRLVALVMLALIAGLITQAIRGDAPVWVSAVSITAAAIGIGLAGARTLPAARRLGARLDPLDARHRAGRGILRDHLVCLAAMVTVLVTQLVGTW